MAILSIVALVAVGIVVISAISSRRFEKRVIGYPGMSRTTFIEHFSAQEVPASVSGVVYDTFKEKVKAQEFEPSPEMSVEGVFEQLGEDTDDDARHILKLIGIPNPTDESRESWPGQETKTVGDMVLWIDWVRRHQ